LCADCNLNMYVSVCRTAADLFSCEQIPRWSGVSKRCCLFFPQPKSHENKQVTIVLRIRINKYFELFQFWKQLVIKLLLWLHAWIVLSICGCSHVLFMNAKEVFNVKCCSLWSWLRQMYFQSKRNFRKRKFNNETLPQHKSSEFQTNETVKAQYLKLTIHSKLEWKKTWQFKTPWGYSFL